MEKYCYIKNQGLYVVILKSLGETITVTKRKHNEMYEDYTQGVSVETICNNHSFPLQAFNEYKSIFGWVREALPITKEDVEEKTVQENIEQLLQIKQKQIIQGFEKEKHAREVRDALKWKKLKTNIVDVAKETLNGWKPLEFSKSKSSRPYKQKDLTFLCGLSDTHIGSIYLKSKGFSDKEFNVKVAAEIIQEYVDGIERDIKSRAQSFKEAYIFVLGDFLHSNFNGSTARGTQLINDKVNEEMFSAGLKILAGVIDKFAELFPKVTVVSTPGNHDHISSLMLLEALKMYYSKNDNVEVNIAKASVNLTRINDVAVLFGHGCSPTIKNTNFPTQPLKLKAYLQEFFLAKADETVGCKSRIVLSGHKHQFSHISLGSMDFYCFGAAVTADLHAEELGFTFANCSQNCLVLNDDGVLETLHYKFN